MAQASAGTATVYPLYSPDEACRFIGARLGKVAGGVCYQGTCSAQGRPVLADREISCTEAATLMAELILRHAADYDIQDVDRVMAAVQDVIVPCVEQVLFSGTPVPPACLAEMSESHTRLLRLASDWHRWKVELSYIGTEPSVDRFAYLADELVDWAAFSAFRIDTVIQRVSPVVNFYFDLISLLGPGIHAPRQRSVASMLARMGEPGYRTRLLQEPTDPLPELIELNSGSLVSLSSSIDACERQIVVGEFILPEVESFVNLLTRQWDELMCTQNLSVQQLVGDQIHQQVCPRLRRLADLVLEGMNAADPVNEFRMSKFLLRLILHCRDVRSEQVGSVSKDLILRVYPQRSMSSLSLASVSDAESFFKDDTIPWFGPVAGSVEEATRLLHEFVSTTGCIVEGGPRRRLAAPSQLGFGLESSMRGLGRAMGLVIRTGGDLSSLSLSSSIITFLSPLNLEWDAQRLAAILGGSMTTLTQQILLPVFYLNLGVMDTLGAAGFDSLSSQSLLEIFQRPHYI